MRAGFHRVCCLLPAGEFELLNDSTLNLFKWHHATRLSVQELDHVHTKARYYWARNLADLCERKGGSSQILAPSVLS